MDVSKQASNAKSLFMSNIHFVSFSSFAHMGGLIQPFDNVYHLEPSTQITLLILLKEKNN